MLTNDNWSDLIRADLEGKDMLLSQDERQDMEREDYRLTQMGDRDAAVTAALDEYREARKKLRRALAWMAAESNARRMLDDNDYTGGES